MTTLLIISLSVRFLLQIAKGLEHRQGQEMKEAQDIRDKTTPKRCSNPRSVSEAFLKTLARVVSSGIGRSVVF